MPVTSSCLAFYLGQTGIRLNALIKLLTWFGRPGGHRVSADEFDLFCHLSPPPPCPRSARSKRSPPTLIFVPPFWIAVRILISRSTTCSSDYLPAVGLFAADLTTRRTRVAETSPSRCTGFLAEKETGRRTRCTNDRLATQAPASSLTMDISGRTGYLERAMFIVPRR